MIGGWKSSYMRNTILGSTNSENADAPADAKAGGNFAPVALAGSGIVTIYAAAKPAGAITTPTIKCVKAV